MVSFASSAPALQHAARPHVSAGGGPPGGTAHDCGRTQALGARVQCGRLCNRKRGEPGPGRFDCAVLGLGRCFSCSIASGLVFLFWHLMLWLLSCCLSAYVGEGTNME